MSFKPHKISILFPIIFFVLPCLAQEQNPTNIKRHMVEVGITTAILFDNNGLISPTYSSNDLPKLWQINLNYSRQFDNIRPFVQVEAFYKFYGLPVPSTPPGHIQQRTFFITKVGVNSLDLLKQNNKNHFNIGLALNYRWGTETVLLGFYPNSHSKIIGSPYSSLGIESNINYSYFITKNIGIGARTSLAYYFEKDELSEGQYRDLLESYSINRLMLSLQPKIGIRF